MRRVAAVLACCTLAACVHTPPGPCPDHRPVGCSVPLGVTLADDEIDEYKSVFAPACREHDYCYRYGFRTYAYERADCDAAFLAAMHERCSAEYDGLVGPWRDCLGYAELFHAAVVMGGADGFLRDTSAYCEYAGPP